MLVNRFVPIACCATIFLLGWPSASCRADNSCELSICQKDDELDYSLHGDFDLWYSDSWRLKLAATVPDNLDEAYAGLTLTWLMDRWRLTGTGRYSMSTAGGDGVFKVSGEYNDRHGLSIAATIGEQDPSDPSDQLGLSGRISYRFSNGWRVSLFQSYADVTTNATHDQYDRYEADLGASWHGRDCSYALNLGGSADQKAEAIDDSRALYANLDCQWRWSNGWRLESELKLNEDKDAGVDADKSARMSLTLGRNAPLGLKIQASYENGRDGVAARSGLTLSGNFAGGFFWRGGLAGAIDLGGGTFSPSPFLVAGWKDMSWEFTLGLTPDGEYAANSGQGYWMKVEYKF